MTEPEIASLLREKYRDKTLACAKSRRARLAALGVCINAISHGPPAPGKRKCERCLEVHRSSNRSGS